MKLSTIARPKKPAKTIVLPRSAFSDNWENKPATEVAIGLRFLSQGDLDTARREAERTAQGFYQQFRERDKDCADQTLEDVFNDAFLVQVVSFATCNPNDVSHPYFPLAQDVVPMALTPEALRRIWDELVILHKGSVESRPTASDEDVKRLARALKKAPELDVETRRLCAYLLEKVGPSDDDKDSDDDEEEDGAGGYYAVAV